MAPRVLPAPLAAAYLERLGVPAARPGDASSVARLHEAHGRAVPFENLSIHLGEDVVLDEDVIVDKLTRRRRGGFCYELNGALAALLRACGLTVELLEARVYGEPDPVTGERAADTPYDHLCLRVADGDGALLVDVGFGAAFARPLAMDVAGPQADPNGVYELRPRDDGWVDLVADGTPLYRFDPEPRPALSDFEPGRHHHTTSPDSPFTRGTICTLPVPGGRITVRNRTLVTTSGTRRTEEVLDDHTLLRVYRERFGLGLDRLPRLPG